MAFDFTSLLSGATGSLGLGGGVGTQPAAPNATAGDITSGPIAPTISGVRGGGFNFAPTVEVAFPGAKLSSSHDINPAVQADPQSIMLIAAAGILFVVLIIFFQRRS